MAPEPIDLAELRERLRATQEAAEQIAGRVPPQGWASAEERSDAAAEIHALVAVLHALRDLVPDDLWEQIREVVRQLLLLLRTVLDLVVERLSREPGAAERAPSGPAVQDIPIA